MKQTYVQDEALRDETIAILAALIGTFAHFQERAMTLHTKIINAKKTEEGQELAS